MIVLFEQLSENAMDWIVANSKERRLKKQEVLIREGAALSSLHIVLEGVLSVTLPSSGDKLLGLFGPGAVVGEISFVTGEPASASVIAGEDVLLLELASAKLAAKITGDTAFAAEFYRALATMVSEKLRKTNAKLSLLKSAGESKPDIQAAKQGEILLTEFKEALMAADQDALKHGEVRVENFAILRERFQALLAFSHESLGAASTLPRAIREQIGSQMQAELLPFIQLCDSMERCYSKPRGYAGDYYTIERFYDNVPRGSGRLGPVVDKLFLDAPLAKAVRNRRELLAAEILKTAAAKPDKPVHVLSVACGPARELEDAYQKIPNPKLMRATLLDLDLLALANVEAWRKKRGLDAQIALLNDNLIHLALGKKIVHIEPVDLIYSSGLLDYFDDRLVVRLLNFMHSILAPGGRVYLGHFHPSNPCKELMEYVFEWNIIHRNEEDLDKLFKASDFKSSVSRIRFEDENIFLFAECVKK